MGGSQESFNKKEVRNKKEKKRKEKEKKRLAKKESSSKADFDDMIAYVDEFGNITSEPPDKKIGDSGVKLENVEIGIPRSEGKSKDKVKTGTVSYFNSSKGFGFIIDADTGDRVFVHINELNDKIKEGDKVTFETEKGQRGLSAVNVSLEKA